jgi:hypothetical protein
MLTDQHIKYFVGHLTGSSKGDSQVMQQDWYFESSVTLLKPRNTHFKREDNVYICYAEKDKVKLDANLI